MAVEAPAKQDAQVPDAKVQAAVRTVQLKFGVRARWVKPAGFFIPHITWSDTCARSAPSYVRDLFPASPALNLFMVAAS